MAGTILTPTMILREAQRYLHANLNFIGNVQRDYDDRFASGGAKIGTQLNVRLPPKYIAQNGATYVDQLYVERSTPLVCATQTHIGVSFTSVDLTMSLNDFGEKFLKPQMAQLASTIEGQCAGYAYKRIANYTGTTSTSMTFLAFQQNGQLLTEALAPRSDRTACVNPLSGVSFMDQTKGLFHDTTAIREQYREGMMGRTGGFDVYENTLIPAHTMGTLAGTPLTTGAALGVSATTNVWAATSDIPIDGATSGTTLKEGDIITFGTVAAGLVDCHPETKATYGKLKRFVVTSDVTVVTAGTATVTVSPAVIYGTGNAYQNCIRTKADTDNMTVTLFGAASSSVGQSLFFHKDSFAFVTADLEDVSRYGAWGARGTMDGISMRIAKQWSASTDIVMSRIDVLWGFAPIYPELASRHINSLG
jgi:hypothetical protein